MTKTKKSIVFAAILIISALFLNTCNLFDGLFYTEDNISGYEPVELISPRVAFAGGDPEIIDGSLNRLAFGVSSRRITLTSLPVPVYRADPGKSFNPESPLDHIIIDQNFRPWGNIVQDSDEASIGIDTGFEIDARKGATDRQIVLTAINETNNAGKIAGSEDGISYYFRRVPADVNFRISADFYVDSYGFTGGRAELNGQEAFGFMARDWVPQHTNVAISEARPGFPEGIPASGGAPYDLTEKGLKNVPWNQVYWNGQDTSLNDGVASSSNMIMVGGVKRGMRVYWRTGVTDPDGEKKPVTDFNTIANADFAKFHFLPREMSDYSIYGSGIEGTMRRPDFPTAGLTYKLYLERTNSGFVARIEPPRGVGKGVTKDRIPNDGFILEYSDRELPFPDLLCGPTSVERDHYYVGFFAARDAKVTISNIRYEESPADKCPVRIDPEPEPVTPTFLVQSPIASSVKDYILYARSNVEGVLAMSFNGGETKVFKNEWIVETTNASARPFSLFKVDLRELGLELREGDNIFDLVFIPDDKQEKSGFLRASPLYTGEYLLTNIKPIQRTFIVNRRSLSGSDSFPFINDPHYSTRFQREVIWVSPDGRASGNGSKESPLDIKTAITVSAPGQVIMLMDGIYTPMDPPEIIEGAMRIPIRLVIPRYNSGLPNTDPGAPSAPQPRPAHPDDGIPYPDPYSDPYYKYYKVLMAENRDMAIFDFRKDLANSGYAPRAFEHRGDYWIFDGIHVRNAGDTYKGLTVSGSGNLLRWLKTYFNGDTGLQISGSNDEPKSMWPANNRVEYCHSFGNADQARTNADGFAAKLTSWEGNVFYRCIAHHNIDDGWDLFAKKETGPIGVVLIEQSFAYSNGRYLNDEMGRNYSEANARKYRNDSAEVGGNGFKMGGEGIPIAHLLINSIAWGNDGDGITSNSDPAIRVTHVSAFDNYNRRDSNPGSNFAIYSASSPSYEGLDAIVTQVLSWRSTSQGWRNDRLEPKSPASGFVWRNYITVGTTNHEVYDGNNGKETSVVDLSKPDEQKRFMLPGRSVSTLFVDGKYGQSTIRFDGTTTSPITADNPRIGPNNTNVNRYVISRVLTIEDFIRNPQLMFSYGTRHPTAGFNNGNREIYTSTGESTWKVLTINGQVDQPYRRLDGTNSVPNHGGRIEGDFLEIYQEGDTMVSPYFWGLPKLNDFMRIKAGAFPGGVTPGAVGLWP